MYSDKVLASKLRSKAQNAKKRGIDFTLTLGDMKALYTRNNGTCDYTGLPFNSSRVRTIERINDKEGYVRGNLCLTCQEANQLKDVVLDKTAIKAFRVRRESLAILDCVRGKLTEDYLDFLKKKYDPTFNYTLESDPYKDHFKGLTELTEKGSIESQPFIATKLDNGDIKNMSEIEQMPEDVRIANYYAALAKASRQSGMAFNITFADFKARFRGKKCRFSGKPLDVDSKFILVLDKKKPFAKENIVLVDEAYGNKLNQMTEVMGLSVAEMAKMFKSMV